MKTENRFQALEDSAPVKFVLDSGGAAIIQERIFKLEGFIKPQKLKKKRRGKRGVSSPSSDPDPSLENMFTENSRKDAEKIQKITSSPSSSSSSTAPRTISDFVIRPGGYEHPWSDAPLCTHSHNIVCDEKFHDQDFH